MRCHGCGRPHTVSGTLSPGRAVGDVTLDGQTYPVSDLVSVVGDGPDLVVAPAWSALMPYMWAAWSVLVIVELLARR